jgi:hypothetical protein
VITAVAGVIALYEVYMRARRYYPQLEEEAGKTHHDETEKDMDSSGVDSDHLETEERTKDRLLGVEGDEGEIEKVGKVSAFRPTAR